MKETLIVAALLLGSPAIMFAATYNYVDVSGNVQTVVAGSASEAMADATNIHPRSGVAIASGAFVDVGGSAEAPVVSGGTMTYQYVNTSGEIVDVEAMNALQAFDRAVNIAPRSGVMFAEVAPIPEDEEVRL